MPSTTKLSRRVATTLFLAVLFAANTVFGGGPYPAKVLARQVAVQLPKAAGQNVFFEGEQGTATTKQNLDSQGVILKGYDVVAFYKERKAVKGSSDLSATYQSATYLFTSAANKAEFEKDPAKYAPQYGAFCAYGVTLGVLADPEVPDAFMVYKGKLYVCGNQGALKDFKKDIDGNIDKANVNWRQLASQ
ncbi:MAG: YHS domain-containing protein [Verrucomicrobia bacterium]|nr:YHS domain-containing protein [Verrucomicrobiota bacterium]MBV8484244.1 YHS domain-containing protein [Verrucomicrobiota bacterium]